MIDSLPKMADVALLGSFILLVYGAPSRLRPLPPRPDTSP